MSQHTVRNLFVLGYGHGVTMWGYTTADSRRELEGSAYWHGSPDTVRPGDWLMVTHTGTANGNSIYAFAAQPDGSIRARRLCSTFGED